MGLKSILVSVGNETVFRKVVEVRPSDGARVSLVYQVFVLA